MSFNHTNTFLRSALLENPDFIGDLLGPEDVLRIENEYPELFTSSLDLGNIRNKKQTDSSKFPFNGQGQQISDRLTRLSESAKNCNREQCKPPQPPPPKTSASDFMQEFKEKNKILKSKLPGPSMRPPPPPPPRPTHIPVQSHVAKATKLTISCNNQDNDNFNRSALPKVTVSSPSLKYKGEQQQQISAEDSQSQDPIKLKKSSSVPVKITKTNISGVHPMPMNLLKNIRNQGKKNQLVHENFAAAISKFKPQEKQVGFKNIGVNFNSNIPLVSVPVSASTSAPLSPRTPKNDVTLRHALKSKSSGFLNPVPILLTKKSKTLTLTLSPHNSNAINAGSMSIPKPRSTLITGIESHKIHNKQAVLRLKEQVDQETLKRIIYQSIHLRNRFNHLNDRLDVDKEITPDLSDILEERETETENDEGANNIGDNYSDNSNSCSSTTDSNNEKDQDNSLINIKSNYQFKDPILQQDRQSYLAQASLNRCEQLLLARLLASKYEKEGKFRKPDASNIKMIERSSSKDTTLDSAAATDSMQNKRHTESQTRRFELPYTRSFLPTTSKSRISKVISKSSSATIVTETIADPIPIHDAILTHFVQQNRSFERVLEEKPRLLQEIAHELIYAEVLKILQEEHQLKSHGYVNDIGRMNKEIKSPQVVLPPPLPPSQPQPLMINKCVGTKSRSRSRRDKSQQTPKYSPPQQQQISTAASRTNSKSSVSHPNSSSKILCEVKPLSVLTRTNSISPPNSNSETLNGNGSPSPSACATANNSQMSPGPGSGSIIVIKHSSEINSLSLPERLEEASQNGNSKTNSSHDHEDGDGDGGEVDGGEYTDNFDEEITGSSGVGGSKASESKSDKMLPLKSKSKSRSVSIHSVENVNLTKISELESEQKSNQSNSKGNEFSRKSDIAAESPNNTTGVSGTGTVSPKPETQEMSNQRSEIKNESTIDSEKNKPAKSLTPVVEKTKKEKITPPKLKEKEKLDVTDCDCSELEEDFIFSETEQSASVQPQPTKSPVLKPTPGPEPSKPKSEESIQVVDQQQLGFSPNSYSGADFASSRAGSDLHNILDPTVAQDGEGGDDRPSLQLTEQGRAPVPVPAPGSSAGKEETVVFPSPSTRSRSSRRSVPVKTPQSAASVASRSSHTNKVSFSGSANLPNHSPGSGFGLPTATIIQQLLEEAEKLESEENDNGVEAASISNSISIPMGSEHEEKLYKEIIAEMRNHSNSNNNPSSVSVVNENAVNDNLTGDDLLLNADLFNPTISQSQSQDKTDLESSCASILDIISEGELVIEQNSEETSPGEIYNHNSNNFNPNFNFSPGFYSKLLIKR